MSDLNVFTATGRITKDIELAYLPSQTPVATTGIALNRKYGDKEDVCFVELKVFGKLATVWKEHLGKGRRVAVSGRLQQDHWEDKEGNKRSKYYVIVNEFSFLDAGSAPQPRQDDAEPDQTNQDNIPF